MSIKTLTFLTAASLCVSAAGQDTDLLAGHPRGSYVAVEDIAAMETALRKAMASHERYSFSRGWWEWDRLRARFVDGGRKDKNALNILRAVFRGLIMDRHAKLSDNDEGDLLYVFHTTLTGDKRESALNVGDRTVHRDLHGGGYHGGWGGAARMRIFQELSDQGMLTTEEKLRFREIVLQSLEARFIDFKAKHQGADNHSFGNGGGVALALKIFPGEAAQAAAAEAWLERIWNHLAEYGDWTEWTYYPYGPIFLHGMLDIAEATGRIESDSELINSIGARCLGFVHGNSVRGNPNSGAQTRKDLARVYEDPWDVGYYEVEQSARDGHWWYRMAQHYKNPEYLWAAEQVLLGGRPPRGKPSRAYMDAYQRRFAWFVERGIEPRAPKGGAAIGLLSATKMRIPERLYLNSSRAPGKPFAAFFLYDKKDGHLDNISGFLYDYSVDGAKFLHSSGKYSNVYSGNELRGGGSGESSLDLLLAVHKRHPFPLHPGRKGDKRDPMRIGMLRHAPRYAVADDNVEGDAFGQFAYEDYYGKSSVWFRRCVLTAEGYLVVADEYRPDPAMERDYRAGPIWHLGIDDQTTEGIQEHNWFDAPALDQAWWQKDERRVLLYFHDDGASAFGGLKQPVSQDMGGNNITTYAQRPITGGRTSYFLSVFVPHRGTEPADGVAAKIKTSVSKDGFFKVEVGGVMIAIDASGTWETTRRK